MESYANAGISSLKGSQSREDRANRVCVLGGTGFLGSHVVDELLRNSFHVSILDQNGSNRWGAEVDFIRGSILSSEALEEAMTGAVTVFNFAALADLGEALNRPAETAEINVLGNAKALEAAGCAGVRKFIYASTVYVNSREGGFYRASKRAAEDYVREFREQRGLPYVIARYGSLYGPRSDMRNGLYQVVRRALESGTVSYVGSPDALREYIHVQDAAHLTVSLTQSEFENESVTITGMQRMRVWDVLQMLSEILGLGGDVEFIEHDSQGHYVRTPYADVLVPSRKLLPISHVDLGEGLLQLIGDIRAEGTRADHPDDERF